MLAGAASPLRGVRVLELAGLAPVPLAGLMLRHAGASVIRIDRCGSSGLPDVLAAGKRSIALNLKTPEGSRVVQQLVEQADVLLDPFRPGALEATGLAPARLLEFNPRLIVARLTGYGQDAGGPLVRAAGHDINYVAVSGVLSLLHRPGAGSQPQVPLNLLADFAAGSALAVAGIAMALFERSQSGRGGVVDVSMAAGTAYLASLVWNLQREGLWDTLPFLAPGSAPWYDVYSTADDRWVALGALEPQFYALLLKGIGMSSADWAQHDASRWPQLRAALEAAFSSHPLSHWAHVFDASGPLADACVTPVLTPAEGQAVMQRKLGIVAALEGSALRPLGAARPQPLFYHAGPHAASACGVSPEGAAATAGGDDKIPCILAPGAHTAEVLAELGYGAAEIKSLFEAGAAEQAADSGDSISETRGERAVDTGRRGSAGSRGATSRASATIVRAGTQDLKPKL